MVRMDRKLGFLGDKNGWETHSDAERPPLKLETDPLRLSDCEALGFESEREMYL